jgi:hypothetical protein
MIHAVKIMSALLALAFTVISRGVSQIASNIDAKNIKDLAISDDSNNQNQDHI